MTTEQPANKALLVLPRLRVQNANTISSPMTWGFPSMTAFTGLMTALERRLGRDAGITFYGVGVICHGFEAQVTQGGFTRSFHLTRNPVLQDGGTAAIVEEGRVHLDITLVFDVQLSQALLGTDERRQLAHDIGERVAGMRIAGGSVMPALPGVLRHPPRPQLRLMSDDTEERQKDFRRLSRRWLPGFALVSRDDLLQTRLAELQRVDPAATALDAWLDLSRLNHRAVEHQTVDDKTGAITDSVEWLTERAQGWTVPIPVGYVGLSDLHLPGTVANARDSTVPFRFVESVYSIGQWISPHRLRDINDLLWYSQHEDGSDLYRCANDYRPTASPVVTPATSAHAN